MRYSARGAVFLSAVFALNAAAGIAVEETSAGRAVIYSAPGGGSETVFSSAAPLTSPAFGEYPGYGAFAAWVRLAGCADAVFVSQRTGGVWGPPARVSADKPYPALLPEFEYHEGSGPVLSWLGYDGGKYAVRSAFFEDGRWAAEEYAPAEGGGEEPGVILDGNKYVGFGDSLTAGLRRVPWSGDGYKTALQRLLRERLNPSANVVLRGAGGERTAVGVNRIDSVLASERAGHILILEGINDLQAGISHESVLFNLREMVRKSREFGTVPVVGVLPPRDDSYAWLSYTEEFNDDYLRPWLMEEGVLIADHWKFFLEKPDWRAFIDPGDQHPNPAGYDLLAEAWFVALEPKAPPGGFNGWKDSGSAVLSWEPASAYGRDGYNIYRSAGEEWEFKRINDELLKVPYFTDFPPQDEHLYFYYAVSSVDKNGNESEPAGPVLVDFRASGGTCFVAAAAFGTPSAGAVKTLSSFRDAYLMKNWLSEAFVRAYYAVSPPAAGWVRQRPLIAALVRLHLKPVAAAAGLFVD